jgi:uridine phosphorylase
MMPGTSRNNMSRLEPVTLHHINATTDDLAGNQGIGRYILLPGSDGRAKQISQYFTNLTVKPHPRGHHLYLGTITSNKKTIDVAAISSGMGCPSMEIILHELFHLGAKRFLRVGTAGSLQPKLVNIGDIVNVQGSVRDEHTTTDYVPITVPALASLEFNLAIAQAAKNLGFDEHVHTGIVHCKSSLYAREFGIGPKAVRNKTYLNLLTQCGVLASEMETSALFIQSQLYNYQLRQEGSGSAYRVLGGAILGIIGIPPDRFASSEEEDKTIDHLIELGLETIRVLSSNE